MQFIPLVLMAVLMYALIIRPQRRRQADQRALLASVAVGDRVMTTSGLYGVVISENDDVLVLGVAPGVELHLARGAVARRLADDAPGAPSVEELMGFDADDSDADAPDEPPADTDTDTDGEAA